MPAEKSKDKNIIIRHYVRPAPGPSLSDLIMAGLRTRSYRLGRTPTPSHSLTAMAYCGRILKHTAAGTVPDSHRIPLLHNPAANLHKIQRFYNILGQSEIKFLNTSTRNSKENSFKGLYGNFIQVAGINNDRQLDLSKASMGGTQDIIPHPDHILVGMFIEHIVAATER